MSAPHYRPIPVKIPQPQGETVLSSVPLPKKNPNAWLLVERKLPPLLATDGQQEVLRELSALRRYLRKEQRQLEVQLGQTDQEESHYTPTNRYYSQTPLNSRGNLCRYNVPRINRNQE